MSFLLPYLIQQLILQSTILKVKCKNYAFIKQNEAEQNLLSIPNSIIFWCSVTERTITIGSDETNSCWHRTWDFSVTRQQPDHRSSDERRNRFPVSFCLGPIFFSSIRKSSRPNFEIRYWFFSHLFGRIKIAFVDEISLFLSLTHTHTQTNSHLHSRYNVLHTHPFLCLSLSLSLSL